MLHTLSIIRLQCGGLCLVRLASLACNSWYVTQHLLAYIRYFKSFQKVLLHSFDHWARRLILCFLSFISAGVTSWVYSVNVHLSTWCTEVQCMYSLSYFRSFQSDNEFLDHRAYQSWQSRLIKTMRELLQIWPNWQDFRSRRSTTQQWC